MDKKSNIKYHEELHGLLFLEEFKVQLFSDPDFTAANAPRAGMGSEDYNHWKT